MSLQTLTGIPRQLEAGTTLVFTESFTDFPASSWTARLVINMGPNAPIAVDATISGVLFLFTLSHIVTAGIPPGDYEYAIYCTSGVQRGNGKTGTLTVIPDLAQVIPASFAQTMVDTLQTAIQTLSGTGNQSVSFNGQSFSKYDIRTLREQLAFYQAQVIEEKRKLDAQRGADVGGNIVTRFNPTQCGDFRYNGGPWNGN